MGETESFARWLKETGRFPAFKLRRFQLRLDGMSQSESWYAAAREYGWTDNWRPPLQSDREKGVEEGGDRPQTEAKSQEQSYPRTVNVSERPPNSGEHRDSGQDEDFDRDLTPRGPDLPELSDTTHYDDVEGEDSISEEDASAADPEAERFLEMLSSSSDDRQSGSDSGSSQGQSDGLGSPQAKPFWQMTRGEFHEHQWAKGERDRQKINREFKSLIAQALSEGKPVDARTLAEYPDLIVNRMSSAADS